VAFCEGITFSHATIAIGIWLVGYGAEGEVFVDGVHCVNSCGSNICICAL